MALGGNCTPRFLALDDSCGCDLTRTTIKTWTPQDIEDLQFKEVGLDKLLLQQKELRITGVKENGLSALLMGRLRKGSQGSLGQDAYGKSIISPFSLHVQPNVVNANYWQVESGSADPAAGVGGVHSGSWRLVVKNHAGTFASPLTNIEKYFLLSKYVAVLYVNTGTGVAYTIHAKITAAANADAGGVSKALITIEPPYSTAGWAALTAPQQAVFHPTAGVVINMANSVSDYEEWCQNYPSENTNRLRDFWWQTTRDTWCYNDEYLKALTSEQTGLWFKKFKTLPLAAQRKRQGEQWERDFWHTVFYGNRITEKQTPNTYSELPQVFDAIDTDCALEYKANTIGVFHQLAECQRVLDSGGGPLDMDLVKLELYNMSRLTGSTRLSALTDRFTYGNLIQVMDAYYKAKYGIDTTRFMEMGKKLQFGEFIAWDYTVFQFPEDGFELAVFKEPAFDDMLAAFPTAQKSRGRGLYILDWSDIHIPVAAVKSVKRNTPDPTTDALYKCRIAANITHFMLQSTKFQVQVHDPNRHLIIHNFSNQCPTISSDICTEYEGS